MAGTGSSVAVPFAERAKSSAVLLVRIEGERMFMAPLRSTTSTPSFQKAGRWPATALMVRPQETPISGTRPRPAIIFAAAWATPFSKRSSSVSPPCGTTTDSFRPQRFCSRLSRVGWRRPLGTISMRTMPLSRASVSNRLACQRVRPSSSARSRIVMSRS
jgi:hypothetical protein